MKRDHGTRQACRKLAKKTSREDSAPEALHANIKREKQF